MYSLVHCCGVVLFPVSLVRDLKFFIFPVILFPEFSSYMILLLLRYYCYYVYRTVYYVNRFVV